MAKRRKKKNTPIVHLSAGPLPDALMLRFAGQRLVFTDASRLQHGGLAAILYATTDSEPTLNSRRVALVGSNELELQAAIFGLEQAGLHFPGQTIALFSDNQDAITRLNRAKQLGIEQDVLLAEYFPEIAGRLSLVSFHWIKGHGRCRGNALADTQARLAAGARPEAWQSSSKQPETSQRPPSPAPWPAPTAGG